MKIVIQWDPDASSAPAGFKIAVKEAVAYIDRLVGNNITTTMEFGWGKSGGISANQPGVAAISQPATVSIFDPTPANTTSIVNAMSSAYATNGLSAWLTPSVLTADFATTSGFTFFELAYPQALAMNLLGSTQVDSTTGLVALGSTLNWNYDVHGASNPSFLDAVSAMLHEITHDLGRVAGFTSGMQTVETQFDFFRYNSSGQLQTAPGGGYFSLNGSVLTLPFEAANMDPADWVESVSQDSNGYAPFGNAFNYSAVDMLELKALGYQVHEFTNSYLGDATSEALIASPTGVLDVGALSGGVLRFTKIGTLGAGWNFVADGDFLGDGVSDALIQSSTGVLQVVEDVGGQAELTNVGALASTWTIHGAGDFYGDMNNEFLMESTLGAVELGHVTNGKAAYVKVGALTSAWSIHGVGNFLGDGTAGFLAENTTGALEVGEVGLNNKLAVTAVGTLASQWSIEGVGDFLGHGKDQFLLANSVGAVDVGEIGSNHQTTLTQLTSNIGAGWTFVATGDFLGEGHDQFLIENAAGVVDLADWTSGALHLTQVSTVSLGWHFH